MGCCLEMQFILSYITEHSFQVFCVEIVWPRCPEWRVAGDKSSLTAYLAGWLAKSFSLSLTCFTCKMGIRTGRLNELIHVKWRRIAKAEVYMGEVQRSPKIHPANQRQRKRGSDTAWHTYIHSTPFGGPRLCRRYFIVGIVFPSLAGIQTLAFGTHVAFQSSAWVVEGVGEEANRSVELSESPLPTESFQNI